MIVSAYIGESNFDKLRLNDEKRLTHANFAFAVVKHGEASVEHWKNAENVRHFLKNKGDIKALLSIGGWGAGGFSPACATKEGREKLSISLIDIMQDYGFDGIDLDWEYPADDMAGIEAHSDDKKNYTAWVALLREKIGNNKLLTMAAGAMQRCVDNLEIAKLVDLMDIFNIMTYDLCNWSKTSHHTSLYPSDICKTMYGQKAIEMYHKAGIPKQKLTLGAAFYGRVYIDTDGMDKPTDGTPPNFTGGYADTLRFIKEAGGYTYDKKAEAAYAYNANKRQLVTFDNPRSLVAKVNYIKKMGIAGIMFWEYNCDDLNSSLLAAISTEVNNEA